MSENGFRTVIEIDTVSPQQNLHHRDSSTQRWERITQSKLPSLTFELPKVLISTSARPCTITVILLWLTADSHNWHDQRRYSLPSTRLRSKSRNRRLIRCPRCRRRTPRGSFQRHRPRPNRWYRRFRSSINWRQTLPHHPDRSYRPREGYRECHHLPLQWCVFLHLRASATRRWRIWTFKNVTTSLSASCLGS